MPLSADDRKTALAAKRVSQGTIARALGVSHSLVCHVVAGRRWMGDDGRRVVEYVANVLELPVEEAFPEAHKDRAGKPYRKDRLTPDSAA